MSKIFKIYTNIKCKLEKYVDQSFIVFCGINNLIEKFELLG